MGAFCCKQMSVITHVSIMFFMNKENSQFMRIALEEAKKAFLENEVPVGAVVVLDRSIVARAHNRNVKSQNPVRHAEIIAIEEASKILKNERLLDCDIYVTKEPCAMCAGAIVHARIRNVFIGTEDPKYGACGTVLSVCGNKQLNHIPNIEFGLLQEESSCLLKDFFKKLRT